MGRLVVLSRGLVRVGRARAGRAADRRGAEARPPDAVHAQLESYLPVLARAYGGRNFQPIWTDATGLNAAGRSVVGAIRLADQDGLNAADYLVPSIESPAADPSRAAETDVLLSAAALRLARDLGWGLTSPSEVDRDNDYVPRRFDAANAANARRRAGSGADSATGSRVSHGCDRASSAERRHNGAGH